MITRAIVEDVVDRFHVKIRIPQIDRVKTSNLHTATENLTTATYATLPGCEVDIQVGDVVIVDLGLEAATIIGYLYRSESINKRVSFNLESLTVTDKAELPFSTKIGDVTPVEISMLSGVSDNIQIQLNELTAKVDELLSRE